jgi:hypothetical protein
MYEHPVVEARITPARKALKKLVKVIDYSWLKSRPRTIALGLRCR